MARALLSGKYRSLNTSINFNMRMTEKSKTTNRLQLENTKNKMKQNTKTQRKQIGLMQLIAEIN